jgi:single-strand DNA-binding protein
MNGKNSVQLVGYVGQHLNQSGNGKGLRVALRVATHYYFKDESGKPVDRTTWHDVLVWDETAEFAVKNFVKGSRIMVEGRIVNREFTGRDGKKHVSTHIKAYNLVNLDR